MRRLLYLALVLVLLAMTGMTLVRVTTSAAYVTRSLKMRLKEGMTRDEVHALVGRAPDRTYAPPGAKLGTDFWRFDEQYHLHVGYDADTNVIMAIGCWKDAEPSGFDKLLESFGYPEVPHVLP